MHVEQNLFDFNIRSGRLRDASRRGEIIVWPVGDVVAREVDAGVVSGLDEIEPSRVDRVAAVGHGHGIGKPSID